MDVKQVINMLHSSFKIYHIIFCFKYDHNMDAPEICIRALQCGQPHFPFLRIPKITFAFWHLFWVIHYNPCELFFRLVIVNPGSTCIYKVRQFSPMCITHTYLNSIVFALCLYLCAFVDFKLVLTSGDFLDKCALLMAISW